MKPHLTQLMNGLHTWIGLLFGWLLFAVFLTGALTVFDTEITAWMQPELHEITAEPDRISGSALWPVPLTVKLQEKRTFSGQTVDPLTGRLVTFRDTQGGDFFY